MIFLSDGNLEVVIFWNHNLGIVEKQFILGGSLGDIDVLGFLSSLPDFCIDYWNRGVLVLGLMNFLESWSILVFLELNLGCLYLDEVFRFQKVLIMLLEDWVPFTWKIS